MAIESILYIYIVALCMGAIILFLSSKKKQGKSKSPKMKYEDVLQIIDVTVARELSFRVEDYKLRDVVIPDFESEMKSTTFDIVDGLGKDLLDSAYFYHPRDYYILYISRQVRFVLVEYLNSKKI